MGIEYILNGNTPIISAKQLRFVLDQTVAARVEKGILSLRSFRLSHSERLKNTEKSMVLGMFAVVIFVIFAKKAR